MAVAQGIESKAAGNEHLKAGRIAEAVVCYSQALEVELPSEEKAAVLANRALAHLKTKQHAACIADCDAAISLQPRYVKAFYRRAQAHEAQQKYENAFKDVREVLRIDSANKEAQALAAKLKRAIEMRAATGDLSTPSLAVESLHTATSVDERVLAVGKLSRIAEDTSRATELLHASAIAPLVDLLPDVTSKEPSSPAAPLSANQLEMPLVGLVVEALERISLSEEPLVRREIVMPANAKRATQPSTSTDTTVKRLFAVASAAAGARATLVGTDGAEHAQLKNCLTTSTKALNLLANLASSRAALGSQDEQGSVVQGLLGYVRHAEENVQRAAMDGLLRIANADGEACSAVLPEVIKGLMFLLGDDEGWTHRVSLAILSRLLVKKGDDKEGGDSNTNALCAACEKALSPVLRNAEADWDEHVAAVHGVTAVLEVNKEVGAWLLRQESIFWSLAEVVELDDEDLQKSLAEVYAHAAADVQHFRDQAGDEPIKHLKEMLKSTKPKVRSRACVALAKICLLHHNHRVTINPTGKLLSATLGLLEAKVPPSVHRWATEALMFLSVMPDVKEHLAQKEVRFGSLIALADSAGHDSSFHFPLISAFRRLCVEREKSDDAKRLETEMYKSQIEQMRQLAAGGMGAAPNEREDDPELLTKLAATLAEDDATLVVAEIVAHAREDSVACRRAAAQVLLAMSQTASARGKIVQQGGFKALITLVLSTDTATEAAAAWALAKVAISINPVMYPRRPGSGPESLIKPLLKLIDGADNELQQFEGCMALCNLATDAELKERIVSANGWRTLQMCLACENPLVQRSAVEAMSNLVTHDKILERFLDASSTDVKIFVGFCGADDPKAQIAASGAIAMLAGVPEVGAALIGAGVVEPLVEIALVSEAPELLHRAAVALERLFELNLELMVGREGSEPPAHLLTALGALIMLSKSGFEVVKKSALTAIVLLSKERPDVSLPPPDAVAMIISKLKEEHAQRQAEAEAAAEAAAEAGDEADDTGLVGDAADSPADQTAVCGTEV